jgi:hypothetical protein
MDPFNIYELAEQHNLSGIELSVLFMLVLRADWRTQVWSGTEGDLAATMHTRTVVGNALTHLGELGLVEILRPCRQGGQGRVRISCYCEVVGCTEAMIASAQKARNQTIEAEDEIASRLRGDCAPKVSDRAMSLRESGLTKEQRNKEEGGSGARIVTRNNRQATDHLDATIIGAQAVFAGFGNDTAPASAEPGRGKPDPPRHLSDLDVENLRKFWHVPPNCGPIFEDNRGIYYIDPFKHHVYITEFEVAEE